MAKKAKKEVIEETVTEQEIMDVVEEFVEDPKPVAVAAKRNVKPKWEVKDRVYLLKNGLSPLSYRIKSSGIFFFDEEIKEERELRYTLNQKTPFVDEFKGDARVGHIVFRSGTLRVPRNKQTLQKLLSLYHPHRGKLFMELDEVKNAENHLDWLEFEIAAMNAANSLDIDTAEAVMRVELGSRVTKMSSKELKRDVLLYAKNNPQLFLELVSDENVILRNFGIKAVEQKIIALSSDQRTFNWASTGRKLMTVPFEEHPYSALAAWFKTDEGLEIYSSVEKRLK